MYTTGTILARTLKTFNIKVGPLDLISNFFFCYLTRQTNRFEQGIIQEVHWLQSPQKYFEKHLLLFRIAREQKIQSSLHLHCKTLSWHFFIQPGVHLIKLEHCLQHFKCRFWCLKCQIIGILNAPFWHFKCLFLVF